MKLTILKQQNRAGSLAAAFDVEAAVLLHAAFWLLLLMMFGCHLGIGQGLLMILLPLGMALLARKHVFGRYLVFYVLLLTVVIVLLLYRFFSNAFLELVNTAVMTVNHTAGFRFIPFHTTTPEGKEGLYQFAAEAVLMALSSAILGQAAAHRHAGTAFWLTTIPVAAGLLLFLKPGLPIILFFLAALLLFFLHCLAGTEHSGFGETNLFFQTAGGIFVFLLLFLALFSNYSGSAAVQSVRDSVSNEVRTIRYAPEETAEGEEGPVFRLIMDQPAWGYLRETSGSDYVDETWKPLSSDSRSGVYEGLDQWLAQKNFYPMMQLSTLYGFDAQRTGSAAKTGTVQVENLGLYSDELHLFYEAVPTADLLGFCKPTEQAVQASGWKGQRNYTYTSYLPVFDDYGTEDLTEWVETLKETEGYDTYREAEAMYRAFVHENYLDIDEKYADMLAGTGVKGLGSSRYPDIVYGVRKYLQDRFTTTEKPEPVVNGNDALLQFVDETRAGTDRQFATLAALMFREAGVPSRYMEGFFLSPSEMKEYSNMKEISLELYENDRHAWVEIYEDGIGWVPVEVTPGFFSLKQEETPQLTEAVKKVSNRTPKPYYDSAPLPDKPAATPPAQQTVDNTWQKILLAVLAALLAIAGIWFGGKAALRRKIAAADGLGSTRFGYRFFLWLLKRRGYDVDREDPWSLEEDFGPACREYLELVYRDTYGAENGCLTPEERKTAADYVLDYWDDRARFQLCRNMSARSPKKRGTAMAMITEVDGPLDVVSPGADAEDSMPSEGETAGEAEGARELE